MVSARISDGFGAQRERLLAEFHMRRFLRASHEAHPPVLDGRLNLSTKEVVRAIGSPRLFQRMRCAKWIVPLFQSRDQLYPAAQILHAQQRLQNGERPPLLPSEIKQRAKSGLS